MGVWEYFTPEQQEKMMKQMERFHDDEIKEIRKESFDLIANLQLEMEKGTPPESPAVVHFTKLLQELSELFMDPDPEVDQAVERFHVENPEQEVHGINLKLYRYIETAKKSTLV